MLEIEDYAFLFGLCFSRPIMLKIMLFKVENNSLELTRIFKESFKDQR